MSYIIILPVHNEENFIGNALDSIVKQTLQPKEVIVVNDNSTDKSTEIIDEYVQKYPFIKTLHSGSEETTHRPGSKIVNAFYKGFEMISKDWDFIVKLDADVLLPSNYYEKISKFFSKHPKVGIAGGIAMIKKEGEWVHENIGNKDQVRGPFKSYSKECFEKIGGIRRTIGWDTLDELLARFHGFEVKVLPELEVRLQKPTGTDYKKLHGKKIGEGFYRLDYGWMISLIAAAKAGWKKRDPILTLKIMNGYWKSLLRSDSKQVTKEEGQFIRRYRRKGILRKLRLVY